MRLATIFLLTAIICASAPGTAVEFTPAHPAETAMENRVPSPGRYFHEIAEEDTADFAWDTGTPLSSISGLATGDVEAIRYTTAHPCSLFEISVYVSGYGTLEMHVWEDWSGLPNLDGDLCPYMFLSSYTVDGWRTLDLESELGHKVYIPAMTDFQIGHIFYGAEPHIPYASNHTDVNSHLYVAAEDTWYYIGDGDGAYPYMIRARGIYFDIDSVKRFTEVSAEASVHGGRTVSWGDYDLDGYDDIAARGTLLHNEGDGTFSEISAGITGHNAWGDFDGDGLLDLTGITYPMKLYRNEGGGIFSDAAAELGFVDYDQPKNGAAFGDIDGDGWLDLYVTYSETWHDPPDSPEYFSDHLYRNVAGTLFVEVTDSFAPVISDERYSRGVSFCDFDCDGDQDIYISCYRLESNWLLVNDGTGHFTEEAVERGCAGRADISGGSSWYGHTIGSVWCDFDNDGDFDIIGANLAHPRFIDFSDKTYIYQNDGTGHFTNIYDSSGVVYYETHSSPAVGDYDNDGNLDLFISCVYDGYHSWIYRGNGDGTFQLDNYDSGVWVDNGWGAGFSDYDRDGDLDLLVSGGGGLELYRNDLCPSPANWVEIRLFCDVTTNNYFAYGAQARLYLGDGRIMSRCIQGNTGTESCQDSKLMHFGLGGVTAADSLVILWPGGIRSVVPGLATDKWFYTFYESGAADTISGITGRRRALPALVDLNLRPNPFNSALRIDCDPSASVAIYDVSGRLVRDWKPGRSGEIIWTPEPGIPSGTYLVRASAGSRTTAKRAVYLK